MWWVPVGGQDDGGGGMMSYWRLAHDLAWSCLYGLAVGNLLFLPLTGVLAIPTLIFGALLALPLLLIALPVASLFRRSIEEHLLAWCAAAPFAVTIGWVVIEQFVFFNRQGAGFGRYLFDPIAWARAALAFICAAVAAKKFYGLNRRISVQID
jgi:hypothetical protein